MNRPETLKILSVLRAAYPAFYAKMSRREADGVVALWESRFQDDAYSLVSAAVAALIDADEKGFPPHIGAVKAYLRRITEPEGLSELEAWNLVWRAGQNSSYHAEREFTRLPPEVRRAVGSPEVLKSWALMPPDTVQSVTASHFQRSYRAQRQSERESAMLPPEVRAAVCGPAEGPAPPPPGGGPP